MTDHAIQQIAIARAIAVIAHRGQTDKSGHDYITHPHRVADRVSDLGWDVVATAFLHDVIEDSDITAADLANAGVDHNVVQAVIAITHLKNEPNGDYYARVNENWAARKVKLADIADNSDPARLALLDDATIARLVKKYAKARAALT